MNKRASTFAIEESGWIAYVRKLNRPIIIAHRGASALEPENTLRAFQLAFELGSEAIELDVHLSYDGVLVVIHDFELERTTNGTGRVDEYTVRQLKRLDAGSWFGRRFVGSRITDP